MKRAMDRPHRRRPSLAARTLPSHDCQGAGSPAPWRSSNSTARTSPAACAARA
jgi:hypothetical protein